MKDLTLLILMLSIPCAGAAQNPVTSDKVNVEGMAIHYVDTGGGTPPPGVPAPEGRGKWDAERTGGGTPPTAEGLVMLFVHGFAGSCADFLPLLRIMPADVRCIAVDLPGCGTSDKPDIHYSVPYLTRFLLQFSQALGLRHFILIGHSMGGLIVTRFTWEYPALVDKLILISPDGLKGEEGWLLSISRMQGLVEFATDLASRWVVKQGLRMQVFHDPAKIPEEFVDAVAETYADAGARRAIVRIASEVIGTDPVDDILCSPALDLDTLIIWGDDDRVLPVSWSAGFVRGLPRATLHIISGCGHMPTVECPQITEGLISGFLADVSSSVSPVPSQDLRP